ncbi:unnamed protein product [Heligmosomoides polygyrus]|uniref:DEK_C domain-containing protein n=1 Tax=Heligmosomoides polygyrus TaxID=6339 RepID=A0A3P8AFJ5_HELPZ|nr:unnamed protein product [Heligmosomoides polygyrus]
MLHRVLYRKAGRLTSVRAEIKKFTGFGFKEGSPDFENKVAQIERIDFRHLRMIKHILGLRSRGSSKAHVVDVIMNFLMKPDRRTVKRCRPTKCRECSKRDAKQGGGDKVTTNNGIDGDKKKENKKEQGPIPNVSKNSKKAAKKQLAAKTSKRPRLPPGLKLATCSARLRLAMHGRRRVRHVYGSPCTVADVSSSSTVSAGTFGDMFCSSTESPGT